MAINIKYMKSDGSVRYIARLYKKDGKKSRTRSFKTREAAENQTRDWKAIDGRKEAREFPKDCTREYNQFLYKIMGVKYE